MKKHNLKNKLFEGGISELHERLSGKDKAREEVLRTSRQIIRNSAQSIKAIHRHENPLCEKLQKESCALIENLSHVLKTFPDLYFSGYSLDAQKEFAESSLLYGILIQQTFYTAKELKVEPSAYLNGMGEVVGELRRHILDLIRHDDVERGEHYLNVMEDIFHTLLEFDFPDMITGGLRRTMDVARSIMEKTRGDLTQALNIEKLSRKLAAAEKTL